jgi:hypothetical protein
VGGCLANVGSSVSHSTTGLQGHVVEQLVVELCYKLEGRGFDSRFSVDLILPAGVDSASNRNEYQKMFLGSRVLLVP